jgi:hypothetical protein
MQNNTLKKLSSSFNTVSSVLGGALIGAIAGTYVADGTMAGPMTGVVLGAAAVEFAGVLARQAQILVQPARFAFSLAVGTAFGGVLYNQASTAEPVQKNKPAAEEKEQPRKPSRPVSVWDIPHIG